MHRSNRWLLHLLTHQINIGLIIILPFLLFWRWTFKGEVLFWGTSLFQFWPWHQLVKSSLLAGEWPLWNPLLGNGTPLLANLQSAVFYPPNLLYLLIPVAHGLTLSVIFHLILAGLFMYAYARHIGLFPFAATISALAYMFSGYIVGRTQFVTMVNATAWFPLLLLLSDRIATRRAGSNILWLGIALAMLLLAGHAQLWFYGLWLVGTYTLFRAWQEAKEQTTNDKGRRTTGNRQTKIPPTPTRAGRKPEGKRLISALVQTTWRLGLAVGLAILLSAVQLLPTAEFITQSLRQSGAERTFALTYSFWPWRLITLLAPNFFGNPARDNYWGYANYWEDHAYVGVLPFILAMVAIWGYFKPILWRHKTDLPYHPQIQNRVVPFLAALIPISLILAMGWNTPIYLWVFDNVPGFSYFQAPARLLIWYTLAMAILAGVGIQSFELTPQSRRNWQRLLIACLGIAVAGIAGSLILSGRSLTFLTATLTTGVLLIISITLLLTRPKKKTAADQATQAESPPRATINKEGVRNSFRTPVRIRSYTFLHHREMLWQGAVLIFIAFDLLPAAFRLIPTLPATIFTQPIASAEFIKAQPGTYRFFVTDEFDYTTKFNRYFRFDTFGPPQLEYWQGLKESLGPNSGIYADLPSANNDDPLMVERWQQLTNRLKKSDLVQQARLLSLMNIGYLIDAPTQTVWPVIYHENRIIIQQVPEVLPRAYFVPRAYQAKNETDFLTRLNSSDFDSHQEVIIMGNEASLTNEASNISVEAGTGSVTVKELSPNQVLLSVKAPTRGFVVLTDTFYPGWQVTVDDQPALIWPANLAFRAVMVEAGQHEVIFSYRPKSFIIGLWTSVGTLLIISTAILFELKSRSRKYP